MSGQSREPAILDQQYAAVRNHELPVAHVYLNHGGLNLIYPDPV